MTFILFNYPFYILEHFSRANLRISVGIEGSGVFRIFLTVKTIYCFMNS